MSWRPYFAILRMRLRGVGNRISESLLVVPGSMVIGAGLLVFALSQLDASIPPGVLPSFLRLSPEAAMLLLSTIAGATITTAGVVFSLFVISMQLASGQFSPRVLRSFFRDRLGKVVMGMLAAVFTYCVLALQAIPAEGQNGKLDVPDLTVDMAVLLTTLSIVFLVTYLHRISRHQYVGSIIAHIAFETLAAIEKLVPPPRTSPDEPPDVSRMGAPFVVRAHHDGWVQQVSEAAVLAAVAPGSVVRLETRPGGFVVRGIPMFSVWPLPEHPRALSRALQSAVLIGEERTMQQDIDFGLRQLTDIALRALSPAINDPTTAVEVVLRQASILRPLLLADLPPQTKRARNGAVLTTPWELDQAEYVRHTFDQLRRAAAPHPVVAIAIVRSLRMLIEAVEEAGRTGLVGAIEREIFETLEGCERAGLLPEDLDRIRDAANRAQDPRRLPLHEQPGVRH